MMAARALASLGDDWGDQDYRGESAFRDIRARCEVRNMILASQLVTHAALRREESRGAHFRTDHPALCPALANSQALRADELVGRAA